jgi:enterochelin esterase family protein
MMIMTPSSVGTAKVLLNLTAILSLSVNLLGQQGPPRRDSTPNDTLKSPEVLSDKRVTFRLYAPKASEVSVEGDWITQKLGTGGNLTKEDNGVWSITVGPLPPDFYSYTFTVDGVHLLDPKNPLVKQGIVGLDNMFYLPGDAARFEDNQKVSHGTIRIEWYESGTFGEQRRLHIYTPPGFENSSAALPVFYLLHGGGDEDSGWSTIGRAGFILDNLLAEKKAKPMLIVMPNGSLPRPANRPSLTPGTPEAAAAAAAAQERFTNELLNDVIPFVEKHYRVVANQENRAIAGLSMGGGQTLRVFASHPDEFGYVAIWSAGIGRSDTNFEKRSETFLNSAERINQRVKLLSLSAGQDDFALAGSKKLAELLKQHGINYVMHTSAGGHTWINWRQYLNQLAPKLFQTEPHLSKTQ